MSFEEEQELLQSWTQAALAGEVLVAKQLCEAVEKKVGHSVSDDSLCDMLNRHGWSKKAPRSQHPKAAQAKQKTEVFKKKHPHSLLQRPQPQSPYRCSLKRKPALVVSAIQVAVGCPREKEPLSKSKSLESTRMLFVLYVLCRQKAIV